MTLKFCMKWLLLGIVLQFGMIVETFAQEEKTLNEKIFERHLEKLPHLKESNPKIIILFSGTTGMGKTWLAKHLEDRLHGVRLSSDEVRALFKKENIRDEKIVDDYLLWSMKKVSKISPNQLIILDRTIDRTSDRYEMYSNFANNFGYELILIRLIADKETVADRIKSRGTNVDSLLKRLDDRWAEYQISKNVYPADIIFDNRQNSDQNLAEVLGEVRKKMDAFGILNKIQPGTEVYNAIRKDILNDFPASPNMHEIIPGLYLGNENAVGNLDSTFTNVLCFKSEPQASPDSRIIYKSVAIPDRSDTYLMPIFQESYDFIDKSRGKILVHCKYGRSRSPAIVIAYLMKKFNVPFDKAYRYVKQKRPTIEPNPGFLEELKVYGKKLKDEQKKYK